MNVEQDETSQQPRITWRTQITLHPQRGILNRANVDRATVGIGDTGPALDIVIAGRLDIVDFDAAMPLGYLLHRAQDVNVTAHGPGVPHLLEAIQLALRTERQFRAEVDDAQRRRAQASPAYNPWQPIGEQA